MLTLAPGLPAANAQTAQPQATIAADVLNVRSGPGTAYPVVGQAKAGQVYPITGKSANGKWLVVDLNGKQGWVLGQHVTASRTLDGLAVVKAAVAPKAAAEPAAAPRPTPPGFFGYGIQIDPGRPRRGRSARSRDWASAGSSSSCRGRTSRAQPGQRNWPDDVVGDLNGAGMNILASIVKAPDWARPGNTDLSRRRPAGRSRATYASFVGEFAGRYCGRVQAIEVWNEQNLHYEWGNEPLDAAPLRATAGRSLPRDQGRLPRHDRGQRRADAHRRPAAGGDPRLRPTWSRCTRPG